jgi:hypothetical protein
MILLLYYNIGWIFDLQANDQIPCGWTKRLDMYTNFYIRVYIHAAILGGIYLEILPKLI